MAWFRNHYVCIACDGHWIAEGVEVIEADCPHCRAYDVTAYRSDNLAAVKAGTGIAGIEKELVAALNATAEKMRAMANDMASGKTSDTTDEKGGTKVRPVVRSKGRGAARVAVH
jgi:predicted  nucleic acid-binding Zn-ribbon protein